MVSKDSIKSLSVIIEKLNQAKGSPADPHEKKLWHKDIKEYLEQSCSISEVYVALSSLGIDFEKEIVTILSSEMLSKLSPLYPIQPDVMLSPITEKTFPEYLDTIQELKKQASESLSKVIKVLDGSKKKLPKYSKKKSVDILKKAVKTYETLKEMMQKELIEPGKEKEELQKEHQKKYGSPIPHHVPSAALAKCIIAFSEDYQLAKELILSEEWIKQAYQEIEELAK